MDFTKELSKFNFMEMDKNFMGIQNETCIIMESFNATLKRLGKEQSKVNMQLEEIRHVLDEDKDVQEMIKSFKKSQGVAEEDKTALARGFITILDQFEDMYRYAVKHDRGSWTEQMSILWKNIEVDLRICGIIRNDEREVPFNAQHHVAMQTNYEEAFSEGTVLEILKCGYMYNAVILRKAQVVINMKN